MIKIKNDKFRHSRGGHTQILEISCAKCGQFILKYQKDGVGSLIRLYKDRITDGDISNQNSLKCNKCGNLIGVGIIYKPESRPAYLLIRGSYSKNKV